MRCFVYKSLKKADTYLYLGQRDDFARLPPELRDSLGEMVFVLEFELGSGRRLPREDAAVIRANLSGAGFHVQFPPLHQRGVDERG
jgi:uncharacterized protein YcgL (UPF0745 family)